MSHSITRRRFFFFGTLLAGAVPSPLYPPVRLARMDEYHARTARMLELSGAKVLLTRGMVGTVLFSTDDETQAKLRSLITPGS